MKDSSKPYKGQTKDRSRIRVKKKLINNVSASFMSIKRGDPYGN